MSYHLLTDADGISGYVTTKQQREEYNRRKRYRRGALPANYPVPAIKYEAVFGELYEECMWDTVLILRYCCPYENCPCEPYLEAICDMNWDRCMDFGVPHAEFYNVRGRGGV